jgi:hypothetical protein
MLVNAPPHPHTPPPTPQKIKLNKNKKKNIYNGEWCLVSGGNNEVDGQIPHFGSMSLQQSHNAQIGISVEPLTQLAQQIPITNCLSETTVVPPFLEFSTKMLENFFNYAASFAQQQEQMTPNPTESFVPMSTLKNWFENFERRLQQNPYFWRS